MTDSRLPEQWLLNRDLDRLSDGAWRLFTRALMYCNSQGTDGQIDNIYLRYIYPWLEDPLPLIQEIVDVGWMIRTESGFAIPDWEGKGQTTAAQMAEYKEKNRLKQQRTREKKKAAGSLSVPGDVPGDIPGDVGQARHKDRTGEASDMNVSWPVVRIPTKESDLTIREGEIL